MFNITLCIQSFNFLIAYLLLAKFFFRPVLDEIEKQSQSEKALHKSIDRYRNTLQEAYVKKQQLWLEACGKFYYYIDFVKTIDFKPKACDSQLLNVDLETKVDLKKQDQLTQVLVDKIINAQ